MFQLRLQHEFPRSCGSSYLETASSEFSVFLCYLTRVVWSKFRSGWGNMLRVDEKHAGGRLELGDGKEWALLMWWLGDCLPTNAWDVTQVLSWPETVHLPLVLVNMPFLPLLLLVLLHSQDKKASKPLARHWEPYLPRCLHIKRGWQKLMSYCTYIWLNTSVWEVRVRSLKNGIPHSYKGEFSYITPLTLWYKFLWCIYRLCMETDR